MLQLVNDTGFPGTIFVAADWDAIDTVVAVIKGTFSIGTKLTPASRQVPIKVADEYVDDPLRSSVASPGDLALHKPATDVMLLGSAHAPNGRPTNYMTVSVTVGSLVSTVAVFGDRVWGSFGPGFTPSEPLTFGTMPIVWERAFGGSETVDDEPHEEPRNPVGLGFRAKRSTATPEGAPVPNIEDPAHLISTPGDVRTPAGFAPVASHWEPRRSFAGTYDADWGEHRAPFLPNDFDPRFFQQAPPSLVTASYLAGGEFIEVRGASRSGVTVFQLPTDHVSLSFTVGQKVETRDAVLDTVLIEPDKDRVVLTWRGSLRCDKDVRRVREVRVSTGPRA